MPDKLLSYAIETEIPGGYREKLQEPVQVRHPLLKSASEVVAGFLASF